MGELKRRLLSADATGEGSSGTQIWRKRRKLSFRQSGGPLPGAGHSDDQPTGSAAAEALGAVGAEGFGGTFDDCGVVHGDVVDRGEIVAEIHEARAELISAGCRLDRARTRRSGGRTGLRPLRWALSAGGRLQRT